MTTIVADTFANAASGTALPMIPAAQYSTGALQTATFAAGNLTGAAFTCYTNTGTTPGTLTTRTAAQMFADFSGAVVGMSYMLRISNAVASNTLTLAGGTGVTLSGTTTVGPNLARDYVVTFTSATAVTIQGVSLTGATP